MPWETVVHTREGLYEQVWSAPVRDVAKGHGLSDVGLAKVCRKLRVPVPSRGYWQRQAAGKEVERDPLPPVEEGQPLDHVSRVWRDPRAAELGDDTQALLAREQEADGSLTVPERLRRPHRLVRDAKSILRSLKGDWRSLGALQKGRACLEVRAAGDALKRALRIADTLLKGLERRGFEVRVTEPVEHWDTRSKTQVCILGVWVGFTIKESTTTVKSASPFGTVDYRPNGKLTLTIESWEGGLRRSWKDGKTQRVEDLLSDFICGLIIAADRARAAEMERERRERIRQEEEARRREAERLRAIEAHRVHDLHSRLTDWQTAGQIREFADAVEGAAVTRDGPLNPDSELARWLVWARERADVLEVDAVERVLELRPVPGSSRWTSYR